MQCLRLRRGNRCSLLQRAPHFFLIALANLASTSSHLPKSRQYLEDEPPAVLMVWAFVRARRDRKLRSNGLVSNQWPGIRRCTERAKISPQHQSDSRLLPIVFPKSPGNTERHCVVLGEMEEEQGCVTSEPQDALPALTNPLAPNAQQLHRLTESGGIAHQAHREALHGLLKRWNR